MHRPSLNPIHTRIARAAVAIAILAPCVAFLISLATVRNALSVDTLQVLSTAAMWSPVLLLTLFLVMQRVSGGQEPIPLGRDIGDTWFLTLVLCTFVFAFWDSLGAKTRWHLAASPRSVVMLEVVFVGLTIARLFQIRGKVWHRGPSVSG